MQSQAYSAFVALRPKTEYNFTATAGTASRSILPVGSTHSDPIPMQSGVGITLDGVDTQLRVRLPYTLVDTPAFTYTGMETYDGTESNYSSKYNSYVDLKPHTTYRVTVTVNADSTLALSCYGLRFHADLWKSFFAYGVRTLGTTEFFYTTKDDTHLYCRWFVKNGSYPGSFGETTIQEIAQDTLHVYSGDDYTVISGDKPTQYYKLAENKTYTGSIVVASDALSLNAITVLKTRPEVFAYMKDGVLTSNTISAADLSKIVHYYPLCGNGASVKDVVTGTTLDVLNYSTACRADSGTLQTGMQERLIDLDVDGFYVMPKTGYTFDGTEEYDTNVVLTDRSYTIEYVCETSGDLPSNSLSGSTGLNSFAMGAGAGGTAVLRYGTMNVAVAVADGFHHLCIVADKSAGTIIGYVDGVEVGSASYSFSGDNSSIILGSTGGGVDAVTTSVLDFVVHSRVKNAVALYTKAVQRGFL